MAHEDYVTKSAFPCAYHVLGRLPGGDGLFFVHPRDPVLARLDPFVRKLDELRVTLPQCFELPEEFDRFLPSVKTV